MTTQSIKQSTATASELAAGAIARTLAFIVAIPAYFPAIFLALFGMSAIDVAVGAFTSWGQGECNKGAVRQGIYRKAPVWLACAAGYLFDRAIKVGPVPIWGHDIVPSFGAALCGMFILEEFISILENIAKTDRGRSPRFRVLLKGLKVLQGEDPNVR